MNQYGTLRPEQLLGAAKRCDDARRMASSDRPLAFAPQIVQIAYHVSDVEEAAHRMSQTIGAGPFFVAEHIELTSCTYRGSPVEFDHSSAYGQSGHLMLELIHQHNEGPSAIRDMYGPDEEGLHHVAAFVDDLPTARKHFEILSYETAMVAETTSGVTFVFMDARQKLGHMLELYEPTPMLRAFYDMVRDAALDWDGSDPVRTLGASG
jgi:hypothetical protein